jgi:1,4-dihydroxy-2-naphthoate octaprenyltransferase
MVVSFVLALGVGAYLATVAGPIIVAIGLVSIASAIAYTGGPFPLGYHGLGDVFVMLFFGFVAVCGTTLVQVGSIPSLAFWASIPIGSLATAILVVNNVRDAETDAKAGKRTIPVRFGRNVGVSEYVALVGVAYGVPALLAATKLAPLWALLPAVTLPIALRLCRRVRDDSGRALNAALVGTARLLFLYAALFGAGIALR